MSSTRVGVGRACARAAVAAAVLAGIAGVISSVAFAQPRRPRPKPPAPAADAGASDNPYSDDKPGKSDAGVVAMSPSASVAPSASTGPVPAPQLDGGARLSPLTPSPSELPDGGAPAATLDYDRLLADVAALRARVAAVSDNLFHSRIAVAIETSGDHGKIARLTVSLDDGVVYTAPNGFHADDMTAVYERSVAPGRHAVTIDVDRKDDRDDSFRTSQRSRFIVDVPRDNRLDVQVRIWDDSTMGGDFPGDRSGRYELKIRAKAQAKPAPGAGR